MLKDRYLCSARLRNNTSLEHFQEWVISPFTQNIKVQYKVLKSSIKENRNTHALALAPYKDGKNDLASPSTNMVYHALAPAVIPENLGRPRGWLCSHLESLLHCHRNQLGAARWSVAPSAGQPEPLRCLHTTPQHGSCIHPSMHPCTHSRVC